MASEDSESQPRDPSGDDAATPAAGDGRRSQWARRYPPLLSMLVGVSLAVFVLPSSLNLPQSNPTQTLEYAPVPPEDSDDPPPPEGNVSEVGLGSSAGVDGAGAPGGEGPGGPTIPTSVPAAIDDGTGDNPSEYRCVGNPPRQTEDPLAPPCVPFFEGDNFGATYQGVTAEEVRILLYMDGGVNLVNTSRGTEECGANVLVDLHTPSDPANECVYVRTARLLQSYFNDRYQTYGRAVHFFMYFGTANATPESRRADAAEVYEQVTPFAVLDYSSFSGGGDALVDSLARRGVLSFGSFIGQEARFFQRFPRLIWGFLPSLEIQAATYADVLCRRYLPHPVDHGAVGAGGPRRFGLVYTTDPGYALLQRFKDSVRQRFEECGGEVVAEATFPVAGYTQDTTTTDGYAVDAMTRFAAAGVTTIIWPGGLETKFSKAAANIGYFPEWILAGDGLTDSYFAQQGYGAALGQHQQVWANAVVVSPQPLVPEFSSQRLCFQAQRGIDPNVPQQDAAGFGCDLYSNLRQLFIGIQVAGPRLGPTSIDRGFHAIPAVPSQDLTVPSCYYDPGDYTCIKDHVLIRYDADGSGRADAPGCYRVIGAVRQPPGPVVDLPPMAGYSPSTDPCLGYGNSFQQQLGAPGLPL